MLLILKKLFQKYLKKDLYHINLKIRFMIKNLKINYYKPTIFWFLFLLKKKDVVLKKDLNQS